MLWRCLDLMEGCNRRVEKTEWWEHSYSYLHSLPHIIGVITSRTIRWPRMEEMRNAYIILVGKPEGKKSFRQPGLQTYNIQMSNKYGVGGLYLIRLFQNCVVVNWITMSFSMKTLPQESYLLSVCMFSAQNSQRVSDILMVSIHRNGTTFSFRYCIWAHDTRNKMEINIYLAFLHNFKMQ